MQSFTKGLFNGPSSSLFRPIFNATNTNALLQPKSCTKAFQYLNRKNITDSTFKFRGKDVVISRRFKIASLILTPFISYGVYKKLNPTQKIIKDEGKLYGQFPISSPDVHQVSRSISNPRDCSKLKLTLYQYQTCPFCCKARAFLDYYGFNYDVVEVNSVTRTQNKWSQYKKVPFLMMSYEVGPDTYTFQLKDSSAIISILASFIRSGMKMSEILNSFPEFFDNDQKLQITNRYFVMFGDDHRNLQTEEGQQKVVHERKWRTWVDEVFVHVISPNVYRTPSEAIETFNWFSKAGDWESLFPAWERYLVIYFGAAVMYLIGKKLKRKYNLDENPRYSLYEEAANWTREVRKKGKFMGGESPNLADISMFGVLTAMEGTEAFKDMQEKTKIGPWFRRMKTCVKNRTGQDELISRGPV